MFIVKNTVNGKTAKKRLTTEANEEAMTKSSCTAHVDRIFALLHVKAVQAAEAVAKGVKIENTAADGNDDKNAVFHSAGEHMITARSAEEGGKITKKDAFSAIKKYVEVFMGPDVSGKLKEDECFALPDEPDSTVSESKKETDLNFKKFLGESFLVREFETGDEDDDEDDGYEEDDEDDGNEGEGGDGGNEEDEGDEGDEGDDEDGGDEGDGEDGGDEGDDEDGGDEGGSEGEGGDEDPSEIQNSKGFYILYGLKIKGLKETTAEEALKKWGSDFVKGFGVTLGSMWGGGGGEAHTIGGLVDKLGKLFGSIRYPEDTDEIAKNIEDKVKKKYPSASNIDVKVQDKTTLTKELDKVQREGYNGKTKQQINQAEYSLCITLREDDPKRPLVNRKDIANLVTMSISGLFKKFKHMIKADDVIYLKGRPLDSSSDDRSEFESIVPSPLDVQQWFDDRISRERPKKPDDSDKPEKPAPPPDGASKDEFDRYQSAMKAYEVQLRDYEKELNDWKNFNKNVKYVFDKITKEFKRASKEKKVKHKDKLTELVNYQQTEFKKIEDAFQATVKNSGEDDAYDEMRQSLETFVKNYDKKYSDTEKNIKDDLKESFRVPERFENVRSIMEKLFESFDLSDLKEIMSEDDSPGDEGDEGDEEDEEDEESPSEKPSSGEKPDEKIKDDNKIADRDDSGGDDMYIIPMPGIKPHDKEEN